MKKEAFRNILKYWISPSFWSCQYSASSTQTHTTAWTISTFWISEPTVYLAAWWRHQMETYSALLALYVGNSPVTGEYPSQRPLTRSCDVFFDLRLNKRFSKQSKRRWFETPSRPLWHHCNEGTATDFNLMLRIQKDLSGSLPDEEQSYINQIARFMGPTWGPPGSCRIVTRCKKKL